MPRLWTRPLRELTPETSHGFHVIEFALVFLGIDLYPWQKWLLIHALELNEDGTYRFRKVFVIVGRQNGKTTLLTVLALWWLFVDSESFPEHVDPADFLVLGTAQNLDIAEEAWSAALKRCNPNPDPDDAHLAVPALQRETRKPVMKNGSYSLKLRSGASYAPRAASRSSGRGKTAARIVMDEMREQRTWDVWGSVSKTKNAVFNSQLWGISSAGDGKSIVLRDLRQQQVDAIDAWQAVERGDVDLDDYEEQHDLASALFEWSAKPVNDGGDDVLDLEGILQSNPSIGHRPMMLENTLSDLRGKEPEHVKRTEILCQWVTASVEVYLDVEAWRELEDPASELHDDANAVIGIDVSVNRKGAQSTSHVAVVGAREDGLMHAELVQSRPGVMWVVGYAKRLSDYLGTRRVAVQVRGCPAGELIPALLAAGLDVVEIGGQQALGACTGRIRDRIAEGMIRHRGQPTLDLAVGGAIVRRLNEVQVWNRSDSVVDIAPLVALSEALYVYESVAETPTARSAYAREGDDVVGAAPTPDWW